MAGGERADASSGATPKTAAAGDWRFDVLDFWFREHDRSAWFKRDAAFDEKIRLRFLDLYTALRSRPAEDLLPDPETALAAIIVLDQFPRNLFRNNSRAYEADAQARAVASLAVARGLDASLTVDEKAFLYLPFEHSENLDDQDRSVALFGALQNPEYLDFAERHRAVIRKFGRFPHRNPALGRESTEAELEFLAEHDQGF